MDKIWHTFTTLSPGTHIIFFFFWLTVHLCSRHPEIMLPLQRNTFIPSLWGAVPVQQIFFFNFGQTAQLTQQGTLSLLDTVGTERLFSHMKQCCWAAGTERNKEKEAQSSYNLSNSTCPMIDWLFHRTVFSLQFCGIMVTYGLYASHMPQDCMYRSYKSPIILPLLPMQQPWQFKGNFKKPKPRQNATGKGNGECTVKQNLHLSSQHSFQHMQ